MKAPITRLTTLLEFLWITLVPVPASATENGDRVSHCFCRASERSIVLSRYAERRLELCESDGRRRIGLTDDSVQKVGDLEVVEHLGRDDGGDNHSSVVLLGETGLVVAVLVLHVGTSQSEGG